MGEIHADGFEDLQRIRQALFGQLLHFLELLGRGQALGKRDSGGGGQLGDCVLREILAADAEIA